MSKLNINGLIFFIIATLMFAGCKNKGGNNSKSNIPEKKTEKLIENERFRFRFEISEDWTAVELSDNGDGYYLSSKQKDDIRIYGEQVTADNQKPLFDCIKEERFLFDDGEEGKKCISSDNSVYIYRSDAKIRVTLYYVPGNVSEKMISSIAKSIEFY